MYLNSNADTGPSQSVSPACNAVEEGFEEQSGALALPSRGEESSDPEMAEAEARLWKAIDSALATYSTEVVAIQKRRYENNGTSSKKSKS